MLMWNIVVLLAAHDSCMLTCCSSGQTLLQGGFRAIVAQIYGINCSGVLMSAWCWDAVVEHCGAAWARQGCWHRPSPGQAHASSAAIVWVRQHHHPAASCSRSPTDPRRHIDHRLCLTGRTVQRQALSSQVVARACGEPQNFGWPIPLSRHPCHMECSEQWPNAL